MAKLKWALVCERVLVEAGSRALSIISIAEEIKIHGEPPPSTSEHRPLIPHRFSVVQHWQRSKEDQPEVAQVRSRISSPDGKVFAVASQRVDLTNSSAARVVTQSLGFPWFGIGDYGIEFQVLANAGKWRTVGREKFRVLVIPKQDPRVPDGAKQAQ